MRPTPDSHVARSKLVELAKREGVELRQDAEGGDCFGTSRCAAASGRCGCAKRGTPAWYHPKRLSASRSAFGTLRYPNVIFGVELLT